ncbi:MAG: sce7725 family protein [Candidatus Cloacimonetes bacterium]|nr:sce7725 family protein [Bacteroidota bacterium]MBL7149226.1 sce7725 family protein [Candidatus Cloacimonadota bacterium]
MYFPYLRGKQFELIALREYVQNNHDNNRVVPIVEPVKKNLAQLTRTLNAFEKSEQQLFVILNPQAIVSPPDDYFGTYVNSFVDELTTLVMLYDHIKPAFILNTNTTKEFIENTLKFNKEVCFIHKDAIMDTSIFSILRDSELIKYQLFQSSNRSYRKKVCDNEKCILLDDYFPLEEKNENYPNDNPFSDEIFFFKDEGRLGFSDYSIVGQKFNLSGGPAYTVAIHLIYEKYKEELRVRHFKSHSEPRLTANVQGKFFEALEKLTEWITNNSGVYQSNGIKEFQELFDKQHYPGLGYVKKISLLHHLELCNYILNR